MTDTRFVYRCEECSTDHTKKLSTLDTCHECGHDKFTIIVNGSANRC